MRLIGLLLAYGLRALGASLAPPDAELPELPNVDGSPSDQGEVQPEEDVLGELVVTAKRRAELVLPKITVISGPEGETYLHDLLERDLELSGEFEVVDVDHRMPFDAAFDPSAFTDSGVEAVVTARTRLREDQQLELAVHVYLPMVGELVAWSKNNSTTVDDARLAGHRLADGVIGALTGTDGAFASRLILVRTEGKARRAYVVDADGGGLEPVSPAEQLVVTATFDREARAYWAASTRGGAYRLYREGQVEAIPITPDGSIYGIAFAPNNIDVAMAIAVDEDIQMFTGRLDGAPLDVETNLDFVLTPTYSPTGRLLFSGVHRQNRRIYVGAKAISPKEVSAQSPTVCKHPYTGTRLFYAVGIGKNTDLVGSKLDGSDMSRLTWGSARNYAPACSPDGRLLAFFSTRSKDEGPGLYIMRSDGRRPHKISAVLGDVLVWARVPVTRP